MTAARPRFIIELEAHPGTDGIRALRWALKLLWRRYRLRCLAVRQVGER